MSNLHLYPWEEFLKNKSSFKLFGYGSLINKFSSIFKFNNPKELEIVQAYDVKRVFNYYLDENIRQRPVYKDLNRGEPYLAALNIVEGDGYQANGVLFEVNSDEFPEFIKREIGYNLIEITYSPFGFRNSKRRFKCYTLSAPNDFKGKKLVDNDLLPNIPYYLLCRSGAEAVSKEFLDVWLNTTYLGTGQTAKIWENEANIF
ncbi:gamma-glutamylcyclotransferase family protein [Cyclobacterium marinum]|uniref:AIG2 family protein n=1 Tax=Cyclobacterium marinum (strain ATCC 25205 / DSM 745 / LMG 13164 / NCIMB 1802) TaxID=880070 RepID=G0J729_CYCMS|nr:gamma-glutamylcyclotransferase family protein [Cyclobacterium marinum]AEL26920.1 hypothetical protein Cycma_3192 [Cyclobacterium marinum DSM 745]